MVARSCEAGSSQGKAGPGPARTPPNRLRACASRSPRSTARSPSWTASAMPSAGGWWCVPASSGRGSSSCGRWRPPPACVIAPTGRRDVATGGAQPASSRAERNPWNPFEFLPTDPEGKRYPLCSCRYGRNSPLLRPCRGGSRIQPPSTSCAALHPWLQPDAPSGRMRAISQTHSARRTRHHARGATSRAPA